MLGNSLGPSSSVEAFVPKLPHIPCRHHELVNDSSGPSIGGAKGANRFEVSRLVLSPFWRPSTQNKVVPSDLALVDDSRSNGAIELGGSYPPPVAPE